ncbi:acyltransferase domain-containing protein, partial [Streptomyces sp. H27-D2]|uniref:acyltransferase domain-containing protein n=1 Tax=Streptomyces sp. H27-D2 TaxID=3046304 RepID=UPI002DB83330
MSPLVDGQVRALEQAWRHAGLDPAAPAALGLLEAHGTGTPVGDEAELATLARVFGPASAAAGPVGFGTVKSMLGHTMQASGIAGLIKAALAVHDGVLPPTLHLEEPHEGLARTRMRPVTEAEPWERGSAPRRAGVNAFGFGGINAHVILEEAPKTPVAHPVRRTRPADPDAVLRIAAATPGELARALGAMTAHGPGADSRGGPCRLALVGPTAERRALAAKVVARGLPWRGRGDVWFTPRPLLGPDAAQQGGRLAFVFPGLEPEFTPRVDEVADRFGLPRAALTGGGELLERAVDAIAVGRLFAGVLDGLGIAPDLLAGHSLGEWTAMAVAGMYPRDAVDALLDALRPGSLDVPDLLYAALGCDARQAAEAIRGLDRIAVSHDNCPHQSVLCGEPSQVAETLARLAAQGVTAQPLPFRSGFHTPMWEPYLDQVRAVSARLPLRTPECPVWSATSVERYPQDPGLVRQLVLRHLLEPVRFRSLTDRLYEDGVRAFVQMGPGSLTGFVADTLHGRDHLAVAAGTVRGSGLGQLRRMAAALWTEGLDPRWDRLTDPAAEPVVRAVADPVAGPVVCAAAGPAAGPAAGRAAGHGIDPTTAPTAPTHKHAVRLDLSSTFVRLAAPTPELSLRAAPPPADPARGRLADRPV